MVLIWGAEYNIIENLEKLDDDNEVFYESGRHMTVRDGLKPKFLATELLAAAILVLQLLQLVGLCVFRTRWIKDLHILGGYESEEQAYALRTTTTDPEGLLETSQEAHYDVLKESGSLAARSVAGSGKVVRPISRNGVMKSCAGQQQPAIPCTARTCVLPFLSQSDDSMMATMSLAPASAKTKRQRAEKWICAVWHSGRRQLFDRACGEGG
eukprot:CAMPEP_0118962132 /NCGR_PEP_ID=MMETSP1173-20130426/574_1 /TAXON_ID=1034831 /ORGANISM="Rhizochromulina marina cf, Strain CCMP1243" /LENGTH=210 /DNA_ID=CAMNT_0006910351 /DNA_START=346 /DNA_END=979 /DNA_ORIENTATION=+